MDSFYIYDKHAETRELRKDAQQIVPEKYDNCLRVYRYSPGSINIQIRSLGPITENGKGKSRKMMSNILVTVDEAEDLIEALQGYVSEIRGTNAA